MLKLPYLRYLCNHISLLKITNSIKYAVYIANQSVVPNLLTTAVMSTDLDIAKCCEFAKKLTLQAGEIIKCSFESEKTLYKKTKDDWDLATDIDHKVEKMLIDNLSKEFPDHKIVAEETVFMMKKEPELTDAPTWFIDPIDGTLNFIHGFPMFCISIGLLVGKEPVLGIIYNPITSELYSAIKGGGAFLNGKRIYTSKVTELEKSVQLFEPKIIQVMQEKNKDIFIARMIAIIEATEIMRHLGSAALSMAYVARGAAHCIHIDYLQSWDIAAGLVIISEAGGTIIETKGGVYNIMKPNIIAASNETLARKMSKLVIETDLEVERKWLEDQTRCKKETDHVK
ncbi:inositol monophosphatase 1-like [Anoplolepis gracilipes]|uniref:inositol monophosphatase 1-like n=1 Tax=Anoplolepis gracilipes TaxID=354296 RepID=UPI003B9FFF08